MNKVQEALKKSLARFQMIEQGQTIFVRDAIDDCKSALSDIEKCEPECNVEGTWLWLKLMGYCNKKGIAPATQNELFAIAGEAHKLYTSSISKEWVGLSEAQENELSDLAYEKGYGDIELIRSAEAKLKELNTCG